VDYPREFRIRCDFGLDSSAGDPLQIIWDRKNQEQFINEFIPKLMGFSQQIKDSSNW
jgi:hypothetical protein